MSHFKSPEEEIPWMRRCRERGLMPYPKALTGEHKEWAQRLENAQKEIRAVDELIFPREEFPSAPF